MDKSMDGVPLAPLRAAFKTHCASASVARAQGKHGAGAIIGAKRLSSDEMASRFSPHARGGPESGVSPNLSIYISLAALAETALMPMHRRGLVFAALAALAAPAAASGGASQQAPATRQERLTSAETYVPMPTISAGVLLRNSTAGTIVVDMGLDVPDAALRRRVALNGPRLNDALRTAISTYATTHYRDRTAPDPVTLTRIMQQAVDRVLGAPGARALLANIIYQRRAS